MRIHFVRFIGVASLLLLVLFYFFSFFYSLQFLIIISQLSHNVFSIYKKERIMQRIKCVYKTYIDTFLCRKVFSFLIHTCIHLCMHACVCWWLLGLMTLCSVMLFYCTVFRTRFFIITFVFFLSLVCFDFNFCDTKWERIPRYPINYYMCNIYVYSCVVFMYTCIEIYFINKWNEMTKRSLYQSVCQSI